MPGKQSLQSLKLSTGGLFYQLSRSLHLSTPGNDVLKRRALVLMALCWLPLAILTAAQGNLVNSSLDLPFLYHLQPHIRYLIVLPILIFANSSINPRIASDLQTIATSGFLPECDRNQFEHAVTKLRHKKDSVLADAIIFIMAVAVQLFLFTHLDDFSAYSEVTNWITTPNGEGSEPTYAGWWYLLVSVPVFQIILFRWLWRFYLWCEFLFRLSKMQLQLQPTHPDGAGGLGFLKNTAGTFIIILFAFGIMLSASLAHEMLYLHTPLNQVQGMVFGYVILSIFILTLPSLFFVRQLLTAKRLGRKIYGDLGFKLSKAFGDKWGDTSDPSNGINLLKEADASAVCDYGDIYGAVREMRLLPFDASGYLAQAVLLLAPFAPLILLAIPLKEVLNRILHTLV